MSRRSLFFVLTLLLACPAFMSAGDKDENNNLERPNSSKNVEDGTVSPVRENLNELEDSVNDLVGDTVEIMNKEGKKFRAKFKKVATAPYRGLRGAGRKLKRGLGKLFSRKKADSDDEDTNISVLIQNTVDGCGDILSAPADVALNTSAGDVLKFAKDVKLSDFWEYKAVLTAFTISTGANATLAYFLYKAYKSEPVQKRLRAVRKLVSKATMQEQKKTA